MQHIESDSDAADIELYPAYCFKASETWFTWVKLTVWQVHHELVVHSEYHASLDALLLFYHNHPIRFVQLVGVVVNVEDHHEKHWLFTIDDGSGATIDVICRKLVAGERPDQDGAVRIEAMDKLDNGVVVHVKGQISTFYRIRRLRLERITIIPDTNREMQLIAARQKFFDKVLSHPWQLSETAKTRLLKEVNEEKEKGQKREQERKRREKRHEARILKKYQQEEIQRAAAAQEAKIAGEELVRSRKVQQEDSDPTSNGINETKIQDEVD